MLTRSLAGRVRGLTLITLVFIAVLAVGAGTASAAARFGVSSNPRATCGYDDSGYSAVYACGSNIYATPGTSFSGTVATFQLTSTGQNAGVTVSSATIDWGDGSPTSDGTPDNSADTIGGTHTYASPGLYSVTIDAYGCAYGGSPCGHTIVTGTASVDAAGSTTPSSISVGVAPDSSGDGKYTITAQTLDGSGNVMTGYNDAAPTWSDTDSALGSQTPSALVGGVSTTTGVAFSRGVRGDQVSVSSGGVTGQSAAFDAGGPVRRFVITPTAPETAGQPFTVTVRAEDSLGNTVTSYAGSPAWSDTSGQLTGSPAPFSDGVSVNQVTLSTPVSGDRITVVDVGSSVGDQSAPFNVVDAVSRFVVGVPAAAGAGQPFTVTVRAVDSRGDTVTSYAGSPAWSDTSGQLTGSPAGFSNGVSVNQVSLSTPASRDRITVDDAGLSVSDQSAPFNVVGALSRFVVGVPATATAGQPFTVTVRAEDALGDTITSYAGSPSWSDTSGQLTGSPAAFTGGVSTNQVTLTNPSAADHITVTDGGVSSQSRGVNVVVCNGDSSGLDAVVQCGTDFKATAGSTFSGQVASFVISSAAQGAGVSVARATINWGDSTATSDATINNAGASGGTISGSHAYAAPGTYTVTVDSTGCTSDNSQCGTVQSTAIATVNSPRPRISVAVSADTAGDGNYTITARALDGSGNLMTYYNDPAPSWRDTHSELGTQTPAAFTDGVSTTTGVVLSTPETSDRVSVSSGGATGTSAPFAVIGPLSRFVVGVHGARTAGQPFTVIVRAEDALGDTITSYAGSPTWGDTSGQLTGSPATFTNGVSSTQVTLNNPVHQDIITVDDSAQGVSSGSRGFNLATATPSP